MRPAVVFLICFVLAGALASKSAFSDELIQSINRNPSVSWRAGVNSRFVGMSLQEVKFMLMNLPDRKPTAPLKSYAAPRSLPAAFDTRSQWAECISTMRDQGDCGAGWAIAAVSVLSDRFCIATNGKVKVALSPQQLLSCDLSDSGCDGGYLSNAWHYLTLNGVVSESCYPYTSASGEVPPCRSSCADGTDFNRYHANTNYQIFGQVSIQNELFINGPVEATMKVYQDFLAYKSGVYHWANGTYLGDQSVKIIGWDEESWLVQNSWGTSFGDQGFARISRADDRLSLEDNVFAGQPRTAGFLKKARKARN